jgi:hypothetical protein
MTDSTYKGSCHCQRVKFEVTLDLSRGSTKCNCTFCTKARWWSGIVKPSAFTLLAGEDSLTRYVGANNPSGEQFFCKHCGVRPFMRGNLPQLGGAYVGVALACLDDVAPEALLSGPVRTCDGRANAWMQTPAFIAHL